MDSSVVCTASDKPQQTNRAPEPDTTGHDVNHFSNSSASESSQSQIATLTQHVLHFLSTAGNDTLLAVFAGLAVATFIILGRLGLLLIGVVAGVILHAYWDGVADDLPNGGLDSSHHRRRKELGIEVANRLLEWQSEKTTEDGAHGYNSAVSKAESIHDRELSFSSFPPATAAALTTLIDAIVRNYVLYWYAPILPFEETFPLSCRKILVNFITSLSSHLTRKRPADTFLQFVTNSSSMIIVFLNELSLALQATGSDSSTPEEAVRKYLAQFPESSLANVLAVEQQQKKLKMVADDILSKFLDRTAYECEVVRNFLREIFAGLVLESVIKSCSQPEFINNWIIYLLQEGEPEIMNAIDAGLEHTRKDKTVVDPSSDNLGSLPSELRAKKSSEDLPAQTGDALKASIVEPTHLKGVMDSEEILQRRASQMTDTGNCAANGSFVSSTTTEGMTTPTSSEGEKTEEDGEDGTADLHFHENLGSIASRDRQRSSTEVKSTDYVQQLPSQTAGMPPSSHAVSESTPPLSLYGASVLIDDDSEPGDKAVIRSKPSTYYSLQIEPASSRQPGWMIFRKYADFEYLHEGLATISRMNAIYSFSEKHATLPTWKGQTKQALTRNLESYLRDALRHEHLAECERMRRFLGKDRDLSITSSSASAKAGFSFPRQSTFESMGKGVLEVLSNAPKGVAGGGKAVLEGVTGVFGGVGTTKRAHEMAIGQAKAPRSMKTTSISSLTVMDNRQHEDRKDSGRSVSLDLGSQMKEAAKLLERPDKRQGGAAHDLSSAPTPAQIEPRMIPESNARGMGLSTSSRKVDLRDSGLSSHQSSVTTESADRNTTPGPNDANSQGQPEPVPRPEARSASPKATRRESSGSPITEDETRIAVELIFAVINELYTLSSAWNIRRTLLNAAKSYILRPGNPHLEAIRTLLQESMIDAQTSDEALAAHITKLRENSMPTQEEMSRWPPPLSSDEKERLRANARKLLIQRGMPQALMSVMGAAATGEALGRVFDCLQIEEVARGFIFSLVLQALRAVIL
ncbi:hypothetical protein VTN77DRAFT_2450 [Rasamsonia byssochlamydoides]|uniref:uncharacterized protein n=1 Tax=Rasamsonia byssochlamydoides TaxID=89139 RepID=UPI0037443C23